MAWEGFSSEGFTAQGTPFEKISGSPADVINQMADVLDEAASAVSTQTQGGPASAPAVPAQGLGQYSEDPLSTGYSSAGWSGGQSATDRTGGPASAPAIPDLGPNPTLDQLQAVLSGAGMGGGGPGPEATGMYPGGGPGGPADAPAVPPDLMGGGATAEADVPAGQEAATFLDDYRAGRGARPDTQDSLMNQLAGLQREAKELRQVAETGSPSMAGVNYGGAMSALGTPGGFSTETPYVDELPQQEQSRVFAGRGSPQFGGTELGMVPEGRRTPHGFSAVDYGTTPPVAEAAAIPDMGYPPYASGALPVPDTPGGFTTTTPYVDKVKTHDEWYPNHRTYADLAGVAGIKATLDGSNRAWKETIKDDMRERGIIGEKDTKYFSEDWIEYEALFDDNGVALDGSGVMPGTDRVQGVGFLEKFVQPYTKSGIVAPASVEEEVVWPEIGGKTAGGDTRGLATEAGAGVSARDASIRSLVSQYGPTIGMLGIDLTPFKNGTYTIDDIDRLYEKLLPHKARIPPEVWVQIENIKMGSI